MKGTLISFDFVKSENEGLKFLEMNTDTAVDDIQLNNHFYWGGLFEVMEAAGATELEVIYKPKIHQNIVNHLSSSVQGPSGSFITAFRHHKEEYYNIFPTSVTDSADKFILRLAYDDNAILDNTYCATGHAPLALLQEYNSSSLAVPFYYSGSEGVFDTLTTASNDANLPDLAIKTKRDSVQGLKFVKVQDWDNVKSNHGGDHYLTNYIVNSDQTDNYGMGWSYRTYTIAYGGALVSIPVGHFVQHSTFTYPEAADLAYSGSSNEILANKHYYEFSTSTPKTRYAYEGVYFTDKYVSASNEPVSAEDIVAGTVLKAYHFEGAPDSDDPRVYLDWSHSGKALPAGNTVTSSVATAVPRVAQDRLGNLYSLKPSGSSTPIYIGSQTAVITYNTGSDSWAYRNVANLSKEEDFVVNQAGELVPIEEMEFVILHNPTGSFFSVDIEANDNLIVDTDGEENIVIGFHNPLKKEPPK